MFEDVLDAVAEVWVPLCPLKVEVGLHVLLLAMVPAPSLHCQQVRLEHNGRRLMKTYFVTIALLLPLIAYCLCQLQLPLIKDHSLCLAFNICICLFKMFGTPYIFLSSQSRVWNRNINFEPKMTKMSNKKQIYYKYLEINMKKKTTVRNIITI